MALVNGANQILEKLEVDSELVLAGGELRVEDPCAGDAALHVDDAKAGATDELIEKLLAVRHITAKSREREIDGPALPRGPLVGAARSKARTGAG